MRKIAVIGMGYVGIPAAALFADAGPFHVVGIQRRSERSGWKIDLLNQGGSPFPETEPGVKDLIQRVVLEKKAFRVTDDFSEIRDAETVLIDVQTPVEANHEPSYQYLKEAAGQVGRHIRHGALVCIESTVAPGTTQHLIQPLLAEASGMRSGQDFHLAFSYERVMVGRLLHNIRYYPRIVGGVTDACTRMAVELYRHIVQAAVVPTDCLTAEMAKTVENAYRDVNIAFANEVALMCESLGVNVYEVRDLVNNLPNDPSQPSANPVRNMHLPGAGVGGHCLPKDSWLLKHGVDRYGSVPVKSKIITGAREVNDSMPAHMAGLALNTLREHGVETEEARITVLGYAFLEDSDDTRNTPAKALIDELKKAGVARVMVHDPYVRVEELPEVKRDLLEAVQGSDCICLVTKHSVYLQTDFNALCDRMRKSIIVDGRNAIHPEQRTDARIVYRGIGNVVA